MQTTKKKRIKRYVALFLAFCLMVTNLGMAPLPSTGIEDDTTGALKTVQSPMEPSKGTEQPEREESSEGTDSSEGAESSEGTEPQDGSEELEQMENPVVIPRLERMTDDLTGETGDFGTEVEVRITNKEELDETIPWEWKCVSETAELPVSPDEEESGAIIRLLGAAGEYRLTYGYGDYISNELILLVPEAELVIDNKDQLPFAEKEYDGLHTISFDTEIAEGGAAAVRSKNGMIHTGDTLRITGELQSADAGGYQSITIKKAEVIDSREGITYNASGIIEQEIEFVTEKYRIRSARVEVDFYEDPCFFLYYRQNILNIEKSDPDKLFLAAYSAESKNAFFQQLPDALGKASVNGTSCSFDRIKEEQSENGRVSYIAGTDNVTFVFDRNAFTYQYSSEVISSLDLSQIILSQDDVNLLYMGEAPARINADPVYGELTASFDVESYRNAYDRVTFKEIAVPQGGFSSYDIYKDHDIPGDTEELDVALEAGKELWYEMFFVRDGISATVAAILHIVHKDQWEDGISGIERITDVNGSSYTVINLSYDNMVGNVVFEDPVGGTLFNGAGKRITVGKQVKDREETITFHVEEGGFSIDRIWYMFREIDGTKTGIYTQDIEVDQEMDTDTASPVSAEWKTLTVRDDHHYSIGVPEEDGDYVLLVIIRNLRGKKVTYVSNGIIVDRTAPIVEAEWKTNSMSDTIKVSTDPSAPVFRSEPVTVDLTVIEAHLRSVEVNVTATDRQGYPIPQAELNAEQKINLENALLKEQKASFTFVEDANYTVEIRAGDAANLVNEDKVYYLSVDKTAPEKGAIYVDGQIGKISENKNKKQGKIDVVAAYFHKTWEQFWSKLGYTTYSKKPVVVSFEGEDAISDVTIYYHMADHEMTIAELEQMEPAKWSGYQADKKLQTEPGRNVIIYEKVVDQAGNRSYFNLDGILTDTVKPEIRITFDQEENKAGFYNGDIIFHAVVEDKTASAEYDSSGLRFVSYRIEKDREITEGRVMYEAGTDTFLQKYAFSAAVHADSNNSNAVTLYVTAVDRAGNQYEYRKQLKIDNVSPKITVTYDHNDGVGSYYNRPRKATVFVRERNLDIKDVKLSIHSTGNSSVSVGEWNHSLDAGQSDDAVYKCEILFSKDDDYTLNISCIDRAGNREEKNFQDTFTIDTTAPVIKVSYDRASVRQEGYSKEEVTATITITEHNFDADKVQLNTEVDGQKGKTPVISDFVHNGDVHTATILYREDGHYTLEADYTDRAGNAADRYTGDRFVVDRTKPEITITNIEDQSANKGEVAPVIICTDANFDPRLVHISVTGSNGGDADFDVLDYKTINQGDGQVFSMNFPKTEEMDDIYTLTATVEDKAGNVAEKSIIFSVNRYGSVYTLETETKAWLDNGQYAYIKEGRPIIMIGTNVDAIVDEQISYTLGGVNASSVRIKRKEECSEEEEAEGLFYTVSVLDSGDGWYQYRYEIFPDNFSKEGRYSLMIDSTDTAGNTVSNISNPHENGKLSIMFAVDRTAPSVVISGAENGGIYNAEEYTIWLDAQDNVALDKVIVYVNDERYGTYTEKEIAGLENGLIPVRIEQSYAVQNIRVMAQDMAGNILGEKEDAYDRKFEQINILVTTNTFVRFVHTTGFFVLVVAAVMMGACMIIFFKKKKPYAMPGSVRLD